MRRQHDDLVRVVVADDHPIFRIGLRALVEQEPDLIITAEVGSPRELTEWLHSHGGDIVITDFLMPAQGQQDGLRLLDTLHHYWPDLPVLVVTALVNAGLFRAILATGVKGLLGKASLAQELPLALSQVRRHKVFIARSISTALLQAGDSRQDRLLVQDPLSPREVEVTRLFATGITVSEIALQLNRSKQTVSAQKVSAMRKLGVPNDAALFIYLQEHGLD